MATRATPTEYFRTKMQSQVSTPPEQPLPVTVETVMPTLELPELNTTALVVLGIVAIVGLVGLFAVLGSSGKCNC